MAAQGRGGGRTPDRVVALIKEAVGKSSQSAVSRETGLTQSAVGRYMQGVGEPSQATLKKMSDYFGESVEWLRGGKRALNEGWSASQDCERYLKTLTDLMEIYEIVPANLKETVQDTIRTNLDEADDLIKFNGDSLSRELKFALIGLMCEVECAADLKNWKNESKNS